MKDRMRKRTQRKANKIVRELNRNIAIDNIWQGRFKCRQIDADWYRFEDGSGGLLTMDIRIIDKKTGYYKDIRWEHLASYRFSACHLWEALNDFIMKDLAVWEIDDPYKNIVNWNNVPDPAGIWRAEKNYYYSYKGLNEKNKII